MEEHTKAILKIVVAAILFGLIPVIVKFSSLDSYSLTIGRVLFAVIFLFIWTKLKKVEITRFKKNKVILVLFGLLHGLIVILFFITIKLVSIPIAVLLLYSGVIYLVILSCIFLKERIEKTTLVSLVVSIIGLIIIFYGGDLKLNYLGYLSGFLSGLFMAIVLLLSKVIDKNYDNVSMAYYQNIIALPILLPVVVFTKFQVTTMNVVTLMVLGIFCTAIPLLLLYSGIKQIKGQKVGLLLLTEVVTPIILSLILFKEIPRLNEIVGGLFIVSSIILILATHNVQNSKEEIVQNI